MWAKCNIFLPRIGLYFHKSQKTIIAHLAIFAVETALSRKLNRVPPLRHILDLLTLVNLMNQFRGVIDQTHGRLTRHADATQPVDIGNAQAMECQMRFLDLDKKLLPPPRRLEREFHCEFKFRFADAFQQRTQSRRHRHEERPIFAALGRGECDFIFHKINAVERRMRFN